MHVLKRKRLRHVWRSQADVIDHWFDHAINGAAPAHGHAMTGGYQHKTISVRFEGRSLYSEEERHTIELARLVQNHRNRWVLLVRKACNEHQARNLRRMTVTWRANEHRIPFAYVQTFDDLIRNQAWYSERVRARYGLWKRAYARYPKQWKFEMLEEVIQQRARYERLFALKRTKEESDVRLARVTQRLMASV